MAAVKDSVLIVGATGFLGRRLVKASIALGHPTFVLYRPEIVSDPEKVQILVGLKMQGAKLLQVPVFLRYPFFPRKHLIATACLSGVYMLLWYMWYWSDQGSLDDHQSLVSALKQVDVVISALAGTHLRHAILEQLKLVEAIKEVGSIKVWITWLTRNQMRNVNGDIFLLTIDLWDIKLKARLY